MRVVAGGVLALLLAYAMTGVAGAEERDHVGAEMNACLDKPENQSTSGMIGCMTQAETAYDQLLDATFQAVILKLDPGSRELVRTAQRQWTAFRHAEAEAQAGPWHSSRGTLAGIASLSSNVDLVRQRIEQLSIYLPDAN